MFNSLETLPLIGLDSAAASSRESSSSSGSGTVSFLSRFPFAWPFALFFFEIKFPAVVTAMLCEAVVRAFTVDWWVLLEDLAIDSEPAAEPESVRSNDFAISNFLTVGRASTTLEIY